MSEANYKSAADFYTEFVAKALSSPTSVLSVVTEQVLAALGNVSGLHVCDIACGQGHLSMRLAEQGASVTGVDISASLLGRAKKLTPESLEVHYVYGDAQTLKAIPDSSVDATVINLINLALMDVPRHTDVFRSCHRILKPDGSLVLSVLHPCFESPFRPDDPPLELGQSGEFLSCRVSRYLEEGHWTSGGEGVRGKVGACHRTLSTYLNDLIGSGFELRAIYEPTLASGDYATIEEQWFSKIPRGLVVKSCKV